MVLFFVFVMKTENYLHKRYTRYIKRPQCNGFDMYNATDIPTVIPVTRYMTILKG